VDRDQPIAMLDLPVLIRPDDYTVAVSYTVNQGAGRGSCPRQGSFSVLAMGTVPVRHLRATGALGRHQP
jgi:hypothetical protein